MLASQFSETRQASTSATVLIMLALWQFVAKCTERRRGDEDMKLEPVSPWIDYDNIHQQLELDRIQQLAPASVYVLEEYNATREIVKERNIMAFIASSREYASYSHPC